MDAVKFPPFVGPILDLIRAAMHMRFDLSEASGVMSRMDEGVTTKRRRTEKVKLGCSGRWRGGEESQHG